MCHTLPRIGYKSPYNRRVEKGREEGDTESVGQLQLSPTPELRSSAPYCEERMVYASLQIILFTPLL